MTSDLSTDTYLPETNTPEEQRAAVRRVASEAHDAADCARLLDMLGLDAELAR